MGFLERLRQQREKQLAVAEKERLRIEDVLSVARLAQLQRSDLERERYVKEAARLEENTKENKLLHERAKQFMYKSAFPEMLQELQKLYGHMDVLELSSDSGGFAHTSLRRIIDFRNSHFYLMLEWTKTSAERIVRPFNNPLSREIPSSHYSTDYNSKHIVVEATSEGDLVVHKGTLWQSILKQKGESQQDLLPLSTWNNNVHVQERVLEKAFRNPLRIKTVGSREIPREEHDRDGHGL